MSALNDMGVNVVENAEESRRRGGRQGRRARSRGRGRPARRRRPPPRRRGQEGSRRPHRRPGPHVPARDGRGGAALPRGRDRHRQAHRGRPRHHDLGPVRKPDHLQRHHRLVQRPQRRPHAAARDHRSRGDAVQGPDRRAAQRERGRRRRRGRRDQREDRRPLDQGRGRGRRRARGRPQRRRRGHGRAAHRRRRRRKRTRTTPSRLAQMEETLKPQALEKFAEITSIYKKFSKVQGAPHGRAPGRQRLPRERREEVPEAARAAHRRGRERPVPRLEDRSSRRRPLQLQPPPDRARRPDAAPRRAPPRAAPRLPRKLHGP